MGLETYENRDFWPIYKFCLPLYNKAIIIEKEVDDMAARRQQLTMDERAFVNEFTKDLNPVLACERMGHDELIAPDVAYEFLGKDYIQEAMAEAMLVHKAQRNINNVTAGDLGITEGYIMMRLKTIADRSPKPEQQIKALELLGKTIGVFKDTTKLEVTETKKNAFTPEERRKAIEAYRQRAGVLPSGRLPDR
jgi:hypothetical protein